MMTGWSMKVAPVTTVPPETLTSPPEEVATTSVTIESISRTPRRSKPLTSVRACTWRVDPSKVVVARDRIDPNEATPGAAERATLDRAVEPDEVASTSASRPGAGRDSALGSPTVELASMRNGYSGKVPDGQLGSAWVSSASGLTNMSPGSATEARAKVTGPLEMVARASGEPTSRIAAVGRRPSGL
jgi:hypothetical protein